MANKSYIPDSDESFDSDDDSFIERKPYKKSTKIIDESDSLIIEESDDPSRNSSKLSMNHVAIISDSEEEENKENQVPGKQVHNLDHNIPNSSLDIVQVIESSDESSAHDNSDVSDKNSQNTTIEEVINELQTKNESLNKLKTIYENANLEILPDKGKKLKDSMKKLEHEISVLEFKVHKNLNIQEQNESNKNVEKALTRSNVANQITEIEDDNLAFLNKPTTSSNIDDLGKKAKKTLETEQALTMDRLETLHGSLTSQPNENMLAEDPKGLKVELMNHQRYALSWLMWREKGNPAGGILADDMGLGKTLSMISLILKNMEAQEENSDSDSDEDEFVSLSRNLKYKGGTLIVCPASLIQQWDGEIQNRCKRNILDVCVFHGNNRETKTKRVARLDVVITTYDTLVQERKRESPLFQILWERVILDEAHVIRNSKSLKCEAVCDLSAKKRWALTGTPVQNKESDLYSIMKFLQCSPFDDIRVWKRWVDNKNEAGSKRLATILKSIMLRRTKQELQDSGKIESMPEKFIENIEVELNSEERIVYQKMLLYSQNLFAQFLHQQAEKKQMSDFIHTDYNYRNRQFNKAQQMLLKMHAGTIESHEILVLLLRLRQLCCHPSLIKAMLDRDDLETNCGFSETGNEEVDLLSQLSNMTLQENDEEDGAGLNDSIGVEKDVVKNVLTSDNPIFNEKTVNSKIKVALNVIKKAVDQNEKVVVISQWTSYLNILAYFFDKMEGCTYDFFTGKVPVKKRQAIIEKFNKRGKNPYILLLSLTAGGVGLNLTGANHLVILDIHWNPQLELQAHDRVYRFGQDKQVFIYRLLCKDTIEERVQRLQDKKLEIANNLLTGKQVSNKLTIDDLKMLFSV